MRGRPRSGRGRPRWSSAARSRASARSSARSADIAARVAAEDVRPPAITLVGPVAELRETLAWLERRPLHGEVVAVTRARAQASGLAARLRELGAEVVETPAIRIEPRPVEASSAGDRADRRVRARLPDEPERRAAAVRRARPAGATPARSPAPRVAAIGPGTAAALARTRHSTPTSCRSASSPRRWSRRWRACRSRDGACSSPAPPRRATCCPTACASAAPRSTSSRSTRPSPSRCTDGQRAALERADLRHLHLQLDRALPARVGRAGPPAGARVVSIGPVTSATPREHGLDGGRRGRAARHRRAGRGAARGRRRGDGCPVIVTLLTDYGRDDDFVGVCHGVIRGIHPEARDRRHHPRHRALRRAPGRARAAQHAAVHAGGRAPGGRRPAGRHRAARGRAADRRRPHPRRPRQRPAEPGLGALRRRRAQAVDITRSPHRLEPVSATFHGRDIFAPVAAHLARGRRARRRGRPARPGRSSDVELPEPRVDDGARRGARARDRPLRQRRR